MREFDFIFDYYFPNALQAQEMRKQLSWVEADILDIPALQEAMQGVSKVCHCAALVSFEKKDREQLMKVNTEGTANVVNLCLINAIPELLYISSVAALGRTKSKGLITENSKWEENKRNTQYAISKYKAELEVWRGMEEGLNVIVVNPGIIFGVGNFTKGSNAFFQAVKKGIPFYSEGIKGYVDAADVARAVLTLYQKKLFNRRYVLVSANKKVGDIFFAIADKFGVKRPFIKVGPLLAAISWRLAGLVQLLGVKGIKITRETAMSAVSDSLYSSERIINEAGFVFTPIENTLATCCENYSKYIKST